MAGWLMAGGSLDEPVHKPANHVLGYDAYGAGHFPLHSGGSTHNLAICDIIHRGNRYACRRLRNNERLNRESCC